MAFQIIAPPVHSPEVTTAFEAGDTLLIRDGSLQEVVTVARVSVTHYPVRPDLTVKSTWYVVRFHHSTPPWGPRSLIIGEKALQERFVAYVWEL